MRPPLRIAILECDTPLAGTAARYGDYGEVFRTLLESSAEGLDVSGFEGNQSLELTKYDIVNKDTYPDLKSIDAILLTGSKHNAFDDDPWILKLVEYTKSALDDRRVRVIGVCFGHQIVGRALEARVGRNDKWEISVTPMELTAEGKRLFKQDKVNLFQMHRDVVFTFPKGCQSLGSSPVCENQGMYEKGRYITVQGHPEFTHDIELEIMESRHKMGVHSDELFEDGKRRLRDHDDGVIVGQAFLRFLLED